MKRLKFAPALVPKILDGSKTSTWRINDEKNLEVGENILFVNGETGEPFAEASITDIYERPLGALTEDDKKGHETFSSDEELYQTYARYYNIVVGPDTLIKIIRYSLISKK
jgi:hypothetical protein